MIDQIEKSNGSIDKTSKVQELNIDICHETNIVQNEEYPSQNMI